MRHVDFIMTAIRLENISHGYGEAKEVLSGLSLEVRAGERVAIVGPSGAGKTTLLRLIGGFEKAEAGRIFIGERDVTSLPPEKRDVAFVFQNQSLYPHLTVGENLAFPLRLRGVGKKEIEERVRAVAKTLRFELPLETRPAQLSGGESQLVALGRALVRKPAVILMDEPLSDVPPNLRHYLRQELIRIHESERPPLLYVTHDHEEALAFGERVAVLAHGKIEQVGTPREIYETPATLFVAGFIGGNSAPNVIRGRIVEMDGKTFFDGAGVKKLRVGVKSGESGAAGEVSLFARPEHLQVCAPAEAWFAGVVASSEYSGAFNTFIAKLGGEIAWMARASGREFFSAGDAVALRAAPGDVHFFGKDGRVDVNVLE